MKIRRIDLDGAGSPTALVTRILQLEPDLPVPLPIEQLCSQLDIASIGELETDGFEAALITNECRSSGAILVARDRSRQRRRFSIAHELGHFLISAHRPIAGELSPCSAEHFHLMDSRDQDRRRRMEAEANRFAALLLMPPPVLRAELKQIRRPAIADVVRLARMFDVSKDALARAYAEYSREPVAIVVIRNDRILRLYRNASNFPRIDASPGQAVPAGSIFHSEPRSPGRVSATQECDPILWLSDAEARKVEALTEQVLGQQNGFALLMLHAELADEDTDPLTEVW